MSKSVERLIKVVLFLVILFLLYQLSFLFSPLLRVGEFLFIPVIFSLLFYYLLKPLMGLLEKKISHGVAAPISFVFFLLGILIMVGTLGFFFIDGFEDLGALVSEQYEEYQEDPNALIPEFLREYLAIEDMEGSVTEQLRNLATWVQENISELFGQVKEVPTRLVLTLFLTFYLLKDGGKFRGKTQAIIPEDYEKKFLKATEKMDYLLGTYVKGQLIVALFTGAGMLIVYLIVGLPLAPILAMFAVVTSVIPFIGPILGVIPAILLGLGEGGWVIIQILIGTVIVQQIESDLISPRVIGKKLEIHPLTIIVLVMLSVTLFGIIGAFVAVPTYAIFRELLGMVYEEYQAKKS